MQRIKPITIFFLLLTASCGLFSCKKYLDVKPAGKLLDVSVFSNRNFVHKALNGIYVTISEPTLYGANLSSTTIDVMAQYYRADNALYNGVRAYNYTDANAMSTMATIWNTSYTSILNINLFIKQLEMSGSVVSDEEKSLLLGEAHGLRAFVAFDLFRLYGPVYKQDSLKAAIPYPLAPSTEFQPILQGNAVMDRVMADLDSASVLLAKDPIRSEGVKPINPDVDSFFLLRNRRMNYYAVQLLKARALLYRGNNNAALSIATAVIAEASRWFPWSPPERSVAGIVNPDRIFSSEVIFGLENADMYSTNQLTFVFDGTYTRFLWPLQQRLTAIYENNLNDYRFRTNFEPNKNGINNFTDKVFMKYTDITDQTQPYRKLQPLMRLSELYYIAAEAQADDIRAAVLLNSVRFNRGLNPVSFNGNKRAELTKEYQKEFWGEGQMFYYYKRINQASIAGGTASPATILMSPEKYVVPLPLSETTPR